ncbi:polysaccharide (de)acetylase [Flavobacterium sp. UBA6195]|uniref:polysaccharide (de)acetylase n=1 Tax=Flavobacterium sp. UBA6195 TaxID=1946554 RepID=UPI0025C0F7BB|nr:polysaccharide (de)acetylase [Flavobacterium sp. UBA6195]
MIQSIRKTLTSNYVCFRGWSTKRKIVVIESDDWGAIRMPSREVYDQFMAKGVPANTHYFAKNDCLESNSDLELLFEVLSSNKDKNGQPAVITANAVVANPDFEKIAASNRKEYHYELITDTYNSYPNHDKVFDLWKKEGIGQNMLYPQFHGREHINVASWMKVINSDSPIENFAFENKTLLGMRIPNEKPFGFNYMAAFEYFDKEQQLQIEEITADGLQIFEKLFGFKSKSFIASCGIQGTHIDSVLAANGVEFNQNGHQFRPDGKGGVKADQKFWGDTNEFNQTYWRRNATFEPSRAPHEDWVTKCMAEIDVAFRWGKPAVINSHRVNYSSGIFEENRDNTLRLLNALLKAITKKWPDVEFMNSQQLGELVSSK